MSDQEFEVRAVLGERTPYLCKARDCHIARENELPHDHQEPGLECKCVLVPIEDDVDDFCPCENYPFCDIMGCTPINPDGPPGYRG